MLDSRGETSAVLETVTAGQLCQRLASVPGARAFIAGVVLASRRGLQALIRNSDTDWVTCQTAQNLAEHLRTRHAATYALVILGDPESTETPATTIIALSAPQGTTCQSSQRPGKDAPGRTWLATTALNVLRQHLLSLENSQQTTGALP
jgi:nicotinamide mononucleotide (NMN) deamidase PncC